MANHHSPIGVFDSGLGGIGVLRHLVQVLPQENFLYFGDSAHAPYGVRTTEDVLSLSLDNWKHLEQQGCKALVVACNTATSAAIATLREMYPKVPMIGIEPALKPAVLAGAHQRVLVMATEVTLMEEKFHNLMQSYVADAHIHTLPAPGIVPLVEAGEVDGSAMEEYLQELLAPFSYVQLDSVVLGCTHFPFAKQAISKVLGYDVAFFDGAEGTARETKRKLEVYDLVNPQQAPGQVTLTNSLGTVEMRRLGEFLLRLP